MYVLKNAKICSYMLQIVLNQIFLLLLMRKFDLKMSVPNSFTYSLSFEDIKFPFFAFSIY